MLVDVRFFRHERLDQLGAAKLTFEGSAAEQARRLAGDATVVQDELDVVKPAVSEREQAHVHRLALLEEINLVQTAAQAWKIITLYAQFVKGRSSLRFDPRLLFS